MDKNEGFLGKKFCPETAMSIPAGVSSPRACPWLPDFPVSTVMWAEFFRNARNIRYILSIIGCVCVCSYIYGIYLSLYSSIISICLSYWFCFPGECWLERRMLAYPLPHSGRICSLSYTPHSQCRITHYRFSACIEGMRLSRAPCSNASTVLSSWRGKENAGNKKIGKYKE